MMWRRARRKGPRLEMVETCRGDPVIENKCTDPEQAAESRLREQAWRALKLR
jgi:hypothetical protein